MKYKFFLYTVKAEISNTIILYTLNNPPHRLDVHFYIIECNSDKGFGYLNEPNITVTGKLESAIPYLKNTNIAFTPLMLES
jgi:hypothetical protein